MDDGVRVHVLPEDGFVPYHWEDELQSRGVKYRIHWGRERLTMYMPDPHTAERERVWWSQWRPRHRVFAEADMLEPDMPLERFARVPSFAEHKYLAAHLVFWRVGCAATSPPQLLVEDDGTGFGWIGGKARGKELPLDTACREFEEETGVFVRENVLRRILRRADAHTRNACVAWVPYSRCVVFVVRWQPALFCCRKVCERRSIQWVDADQLCNPFGVVREYMTSAGHASLLTWLMRVPVTNVCSSRQRRRLRRRARTRAAAAVEPQPDPGVENGPDASDDAISFCSSTNMTH